MTFVDTNILLDLVTRDARWLNWSVKALADAARQGPLIINDVVFAEFSIGFLNIEKVEATLNGFGVVVQPTPRTALFLAGKTFKRYRASSGVRTGVLPDFFIGAHAAVGGLKLLTRDARRFRTYFPEVDLVTP